MNFSRLNNFTSSSSQSTSTKKKQRAPLSLEQLETRMLMAFDVLEQQLVVLNAPAAPSLQSTPVVGNVAGRLQQVGSAWPITNSQRIQTNEYSVAIKLLSDSTGNLPPINWRITSTDSFAQGAVQLSGDIATLTFNRPADYRVTASSGTKTLSFTVRVTPSLTSLVVNAGATRLTQDPLAVTSRFANLTLVGLDQLGRNIKLSSTANWQIESAPQDSSAQIQGSGSRVKVTFDRAGSYTFRVSVGSVSTTVRVAVQQTLTKIAVTPGTGSTSLNGTLQLAATGYDQFQQPMSSQPTFQWSATGGTVNTQGLFQAGAVAGKVTVTARSGNLQARATVTVVKTADGGGASNSGIVDANLKSLVTTFYADNTISRDEMVQLLRSTTTDNIVSATELSDLRYIVSSTSTLRMPEFVRSLAKNVITTNPANLRYQGQAAGNLAAGSTGVLLNNLVDKWFLGTDLPAITGSGISYRFAVGSLFPTSPSLDDSKQGMLGDCYFLASLISIGTLNPTAIRNMFVENADGTVTVRFYANGVADYVTVNRSLPTYSNGSLAYSGYGRSALSSSTQLWLALAEKAYAQWNETGKSGRDGTNTYAGIEGGWMGTVNAQALGVASSNYAVNSTNKQMLINSLNSNQAVTIGTTSGASVGGLVGSHAYVVTGYNSTTDTFSFYNPWSVQHPTALTWNQMQGQTSYFVVTTPSGSSSNGANVSSSLPVDPAMTYVETIQVAAAGDSHSITSRLDASNEQLSVVEAGLEFDTPASTAYSVAEYHGSQENSDTEAKSNDEFGSLVDLALVSLDA